jgi:hypothetical protein
MTDAERRAEDEAQLLALAAAEEAGKLPAEDRRHPEPVDVTDIPPADVPLVEAVAPEPVKPVETPVDVTKAPYTGKRYRVHDPERPGVLVWEDESGNLLS